MDWNECISLYCSFPRIHNGIKRLIVFKRLMKLRKRYDIGKTGATAKYCKEIMQCAMRDDFKTNVIELTLLSLYVSHYI